jgi:hypothetical protein
MGLPGCPAKFQERLSQFADHGTRLPDILFCCTENMCGLHPWGLDGSLQALR